MSEHGFMRRHDAKQTHRLFPKAFARVDRERWNDPADAPIGQALAVQARDSIGPYTLPMKCIRTEGGWISATTRTPLHVTVIGWRRHEAGVR